MPTETYKKPRTILELKYFCQEHNIPAEKMHFYIGEDYRGPKAYGVYQEPDGHFVVYKNKADGTRVVRYNGPYEDIAVNELYEKMKAEVDAQRKAHAEKNRAYAEDSAQRKEYSRYEAGSRSANNDDGSYRENVEDRPLSYSRDRGTSQNVGQRPYQAYSSGVINRSGGGNGASSGCSRGCRYFLIVSAVIAAIIFVAAMVFAFLDIDAGSSRPKRGYYNYNDREYYYYGDDWYYYDDHYGDWIYWADPDPYFTDNYDEYYDDYYYSEGSGYSDFEDSEYYDESYYSDYDDYDWDSSDYDWDWGSDDYDYDYDDWDDWDYDDYDYDYGDWDSDW